MKKWNKLYGGHFSKLSLLLSFLLFVICFRLKRLFYGENNPRPSCSIFYAQYAGIERTKTGHQRGREINTFGRRDFRDTVKIWPKIRNSQSVTTAGLNGTANLSNPLPEPIRKSRSHYKCKSSVNIAHLNIFATRIFICHANANFPCFLSFVLQISKANIWDKEWKEGSVRNQLESQMSTEWIHREFPGHLPNIWPGILMRATKKIMMGCQMKGS